MRSAKINGVYFCNNTLPLIIALLIPTRTCEMNHYIFVNLALQICPHTLSLASGQFFAYQIACKRNLMLIGLRTKILDRLLILRRGTFLLLVCYLHFSGFPQISCKDANQIKSLILYCLIILLFKYVVGVMSNTLQSLVVVLYKS